MGSSKRRRTTITFGLIAIAGVGTGGAILGCSATSKPSPNLIQRMEGQCTVVPAATGFLGNDYSLLKPGQEGQAALVYLNPNVRWSQYDKVMLEPSSGTVRTRAYRERISTCSRRISTTS